MEEFLQLNWGIKEPHELDYGPNFIPENEISLSYVYSGICKEFLAEAEDDAEKYRDNIQQLVPGHHYKFKSKFKSFLDTTEQAKCLVALRLLRAGKKTTGIYEQHCMELYNNSLQNILQENIKFLEFAKQQYLNTKKKVFKLKLVLQNYATSLWKHKLNCTKDYAQFYKGMDIIPYSYKEDEESVEMVHLQNLLEVGTLARYIGPTLLTPYYLKTGLLPMQKEIHNFNKSVSKDPNIDKLIESNQVNVVISSSGLKKLMNFTKTDATWDIPVIVKKCHVKNKDGTSATKNVVFIDKPFPNKSPTIFELNEKCFKNLMKTNFCDTEAFSFQNTEIPTDILQINLKPPTEVQVLPFKDVCDNEEAEEESTTNSSEGGKNKKIKLSSTHTRNDKSRKIHQNVSYRLWKLQFKSEQCELIKAKCHINSVHVLIRTKLDACESLENGVLQPINVVPKQEYYLEYGAEIPTKDELVCEWVSAFFRPCSQVRRIRTHYNTGEIVAIENCNAQKIAFETQTHYQHNLHLGCGVLYKIFTRLMQLIPGNYLLHYVPKDGTFVQLLQATNESDDVVYNLHSEYDIQKCSINSNKTMAWHTIDPNFILPKHNATHQMPGMFQPCFPKPRFFNTKKNTKKKKPKPGKNVNSSIQKDAK